AVAGLAVLAVAAPAPAARWSLGANYGFAIHHPDAGDNTTIFGWPGSAFGYQPGMRLGVTGGGRFSEAYLDLGVLFLDRDGVSSRDLQASLNYQRNLSPESTTSLYFTAGGGVLHRADDAGSASISASAATFGGGVGVRNEVSNGFGSLRVEARVDRVIEGTNGGLVVIEPAVVYALKVGFDLWLFDEDD
ncbi:MAG TPA: outer membrane beta-barrel protein, partial [Candidatus Eisenbacteria bacterium]|nr:outer membrane beta-barrel protein [Candidatus Eisenbacteria bacterium]